MPPAFFSRDSFWNTPLPASAPLHPDHERFLALSRWSTSSPGVHINLKEWTIPLYAADASTPLHPVGRRLTEDVQGRHFRRNSAPYLHPAHPEGHHASFGPEIPIPAAAAPDGQIDAHLAVIDVSQRRAWDMWGTERTPDGAWASCTGISYSLDGSGVFDPAEFAIHNGESIHLYGPGRAVGVPIIAGLILHDEILAGRIEHKLAFACRCSGLLAHYFPPTIWTDGGAPGGPPAGIVFQLDPALDLDSLPLSRGARIVARALQEFGAVLVDFAGGFTLYGEGLWSDPQDRTWDDTLTEDALFGIDWKHFRFLAPEPLGQTLIEKGMVPFPHPSLTGVYRALTGLTPLEHEPAPPYTP